MISKNSICAFSCLILASCASSNTIKTSSSTAIVQTSAEAMCGGAGAANVAQKQAAIETLKAGFDRYIIFDSAASSDVQVTQMPGSYQTSGTAMIYGNRATYHGNTQYIPGPTIVSGGYQQSFAIKMFREGESGASDAVSARETLGPKWQQLVKVGTIRTCT
ncbi:MULTISPECIES: hypothetical protein [Hyphomicrobiales]|uniref:hypothetical protein n=1 Tax=Hyphomicrobiales TaxID=356 RepID=UPI0006849346|nr:MULTISPECIES: hypothetical protein [Phyllobacteriaceae]MCX8568721.1 hypothetical protein [Aminobacter sp. MET-1]